MKFILNSNTSIKTEITTKPVLNAIEILKRDIRKKLDPGFRLDNFIFLKKTKTLEIEAFIINIANDITISATDDLGFIYGLLYISKHFLDIKPFWFWLDQQIKMVDRIEVSYGQYHSQKPTVKYRGWFFNDEVLIMKWSINGDRTEPWRMAFEALLRCGGNMAIPGTDKNSQLNRPLAAEYGLWITHHHAEPLGAEMFSRVYPDIAPNFDENSGLFYKLWEDAVIAQKDDNVIWNLSFRGQGDTAFWESDTSGKYDTKQKRGYLISSIIRKQYELVKKHVEAPVFCTNLYGEIMELYDEGFIQVEADIIKVRADNGFGKMVTRRTGNINNRISAMPEKGGGMQGIYYHVSFYDLQAANHLTMLPNSVNFVDNELSLVTQNGGNAFWIINCSNIRPHAYFLDAIRKKWYGKNISDEKHSLEFARAYFNGEKSVAECYREYPQAMISFGANEDEHAGEQFYAENARYIAGQFIRDDQSPVEALDWIAGEGTFYEQAKRICGICETGLRKLEALDNLCLKTSENLCDNASALFDATIFLHVRIHLYCAQAMGRLGEAITACENKQWEKAFLLTSDSAEMFDKANQIMRDTEEGVWKGFYFNDCMADLKYSAYVLRKMRGVIRELGDSPNYAKWQRNILPLEERGVCSLLFTDNHYTDEELYQKMKHY